MLGENLKKAREEKKLGIVQVAQEVGITHAALSYFENGLKVPSVPTLVRLAEVLGKSIDELVK